MKPTETETAKEATNMPINTSQKTEPETLDKPLPQEDVLVEPHAASKEPTIAEPESTEEPEAVLEANSATQPQEEPQAETAEEVGEEEASEGWVDRSMFGLIELLLKDRPGLYRQIHEQRDLQQMLPGLLLITLLSTSIVGAILGTYTGGWQIVYVSFKLPLLMLLTLAVCFSSFWVWGQYFQTSMTGNQVATLALSSIATTSLLLLGLCPLLWLVMGDGVTPTHSLSIQEFHYHRAILILCATFGIAAVGGLRVLVKGVTTIVSQTGSIAKGRWMAMTWVAMYGFVGLQMSWILRPYLFHPWANGRPLTFLRGIEGSVYVSILKTLGHFLGIAP